MFWCEKTGRGDALAAWDHVLKVFGVADLAKIRFSLTLALAGEAPRPRPATGQAAWEVLMDPNNCPEYKFDE